MKKNPIREKTLSAIDKKDYESFKEFIEKLGAKVILTLTGDISRDDLYHELDTWVESALSQYIKGNISEECSVQIIRTCRIVHNSIRVGSPDYLK